jgi:hypothetical protein
MQIAGKGTTGYGLVKATPMGYGITPRPQQN